MCSTRAAPPAPRWRRCSTMAARARCSLPCWWTAVTASCPSAPITSARTSPPHAARASACACARWTASTRCCCTASRNRRGERDMALETLETLREHAVTRATTRRRHLLDVDDWTPDELRAILAGAARMRAALVRNERLDTLRGRVLVNLFYENSTRTRVSFELAGKRLGADVTNVTASGSSVEKGESLSDTVRTLQALGANIVVVRHSRAGAPDLIAREIAGSVVNAGDGWHAHPTQALLDLFTLERHLGPVAGKRVVILGDILHSRVARSNVWTLTALGAEVVLCGPPTLLPPAAAELYTSRLVPGTGEPRHVTVEPYIERALAGAHAVMV